MLKGLLNFEFLQCKQKNESTQWNIESRNIESKKLRPSVRAVKCIFHVALVMSQRNQIFERFYLVQISTVFLFSVTIWYLTQKHKISLNERKTKPKLPIFNADIYYRALFLRLLYLDNGIKNYFPYFSHIYLRC